MKEVFPYTLYSEEVLSFTHPSEEELSSTLPVKEVFQSTIPLVKIPSSTHLLVLALVAFYKYLRSTTFLGNYAEFVAKTQYQS